MYSRLGKDKSPFPWVVLGQGLARMKKALAEDREGLVTRAMLASLVCLSIVNRLVGPGSRRTRDRRGCADSGDNAIRPSGLPLGPFSVLVGSKNQRVA